MDPSSQEAVPSVESSLAKPLPSVTDMIERIMKLPHGHSSVSRFHSNFSRSMFWRCARQRYGNQYYRQVSSSNIDILSSLRKTAQPLCDERLSMKLNGQCNSESGYREDSRGRVIYRPERIRSNALVMDSASPDVVKTECGICLKPLKRRVSSGLANRKAIGELSIVGIFACGHAYHADCLEERTSEADRHDPPCPTCEEMTKKVDVLRG